MASDSENGAVWINRDARFSLGNFSGGGGKPITYTPTETESMSSFLRAEQRSLVSVSVSEMFLASPKLGKSRSWRLLTVSCW
jgi:hypothetical protein